MIDLLKHKDVLNANIRHGEIVSVNVGMNSCDVRMTGETVLHNIPIDYNIPEFPELGWMGLTFSVGQHFLDNANKAALVLFDEENAVAVIGFSQQVPVIRAGLMRYDEFFTYQDVLMAKNLYMSEGLEAFDMSELRAFQFIDPRHLYGVPANTGWTHSGLGDPVYNGIFSEALQRRDLEYFTGEVVVNAKLAERTYDTEGNPTSHLFCSGNGLIYATVLNSQYPDVTPDSDFSFGTKLFTASYGEITSVSLNLSVSEPSGYVSEFYQLSTDDKRRFIYHFSAYFAAYVRNTFELNQAGLDIYGLDGVMDMALSKAVGCPEFDVDLYYEDMLTYSKPSEVSQYVTDYKRTSSSFDFISSVFQYDSTESSHSKYTSTDLEDNEKTLHHLAWKYPCMDYTFDSVAGTLTMTNTRPSGGGYYGEKHEKDIESVSFGNMLFEHVTVMSEYHADFVAPYTLSPVRIEVVHSFKVNGEVAHTSPAYVQSTVMPYTLKIGNSYILWLLIYEQIGGSIKTTYLSYKDGEQLCKNTYDSYIPSACLFLPVV